MRKLLVFFVSFAVGSVFADDGTWVYRDGLGTTPTNALLWTDTANWVNGTVATGVNSVANFAVGSAKEVWVRIPDNFLVGRIDNQSDTTLKLRLICDGTIRMQKSDGGRFRGAASNFPCIWADLIDVTGAFGPYYCDLYAPFKSSTYTWWGAGGNLRADCFATSTKTLVDDLITVGTEFQSQSQIGFYSRRVVSATVGTWDTVAGQKIVKWRAGGKGTSLSPGQTIQALGVFPEGTFLTRVYGDSYIQFSEAALATCATGAEISFAAFAPQIKQSIPMINPASDQQGFILNKRTSSDVLDLTIDKFSASDNRYQLYTYKDYGVGRHIFKNTAGLRRGVVTRWSTHLVFTATNDTGLCGLNGLAARTEPNNYYGTDTIETAAGLDATIHELTKVANASARDVPILKKTGAGRLTVKSTQTLQDSFQVAEGTLVYAPKAEGATLASLNVSAGATFALGAGTKLTVTSATLAAGATVQVGEGAELTFQTKSFGEGCRILGPGTVKGLAAGGTTSIVFGDNVQLADANAVSTDYIPSYPADVSAPCVEPVFWVDAKKADSIVYASGSNITRVNDRRGTDAQYNFATNVASVYPTMNGGYILMAKKGKSNIAETQALVWARPIKNVRAVFLVSTSQSSTDKDSGALLGSTARLATRHFSKQSIGTTSAIVDDNGLACVKNGKFYINGGVRNRTNGRLGYFPQVIECHPSSDGADADCFGYQYGLTYDGNYWLGEVLVYTTALTYAQRAQISAYLMNKWIGGNVSYVDFPPDGAFGKVQLDGGAAFGAVAGTEAEIDDVAGTGTLTTKGDGTFHLRHFVNTEAGLHVTAGTTKLESYDPTDESMVPTGYKIRVDASQASSITTNAAGEVTAWNNLGDTANYAFGKGINSSKPATLILDAEVTSGKPVVDLGPVVINSEEGIGAEADLPAAKACYFGFFKPGTAKKTNFVARSVFGFFGTKDGGNWLLSGHEDSRTATEGLFRDPTHEPTKSIVTLDGTAAQAPQSSTTFVAPAHSPVLTNGVRRSQISSTGFSGGYESVGWWSPYSQNAWGVGRSWRRFWAGGLQIGEYFVYSRQLLDDEAFKLDAYLQAKWLDKVSPRYALAKVGPLTVDSGATLQVVGGAPVTATTLSGGGTVNGAVTLTEAAVFEVPVDGNGAITQTLTVSGAVDLTQGGSVRLTGETAKLRLGSYRLIDATALTLGGDWSVTGYTGSRALSVVSRSDGLWLDVKKTGFMMYIR